MKCKGEKLGACSRGGSKIRRRSVRMAFLLSVSLQMVVLVPSARVKLA